MNIVKVFSLSIGTGVAKVILISITAISSSCDFLVCAFVFFKSMQRNACDFCDFKKYDQIDTDWWRVSGMVWWTSSETDIDKYIDFGIEVVTSILAIDPLMVEWR